MSRFRGVLALVGLALTTTAGADPCGMVAPAWIPADDDAPVLQRQGDQITYAFFKDGVETMVLRPGFTGTVSEFGMLIPFPSPPSLRKTPDETFAHLAAAVDVPQMSVKVHYPPPVTCIDTLSSLIGRSSQMHGSVAMIGALDSRGREAQEPALRFDEVRVVNQEAVGMYEVAVLHAGSSSALNKWMEDKDYRYPAGMDAVVDDYVEARWAFVAIKAKVGDAAGTVARPGMTRARTALPDGATFDGHVQGMGFRFETDEPVIPMRLASFNDAPPKNLVYFLAEDPLRIDGMSTSLVRRQVKGRDLLRNLEGPMEVVVPSGETLTEMELDAIESRLDPKHFNARAQELFASDLLAVESGELTLDFESYDKGLLAISEGLGLRGPQIDALHAVEVEKKKDDELDSALRGLSRMTLTVFDGDFDGDVLRDENLAFSAYRMASAVNSPDNWTRRPAGRTATVTRPWAQRPDGHESFDACGPGELCPASGLILCQ